MTFTSNGASRGAGYASRFMGALRPGVFVLALILVIALPAVAVSFSPFAPAVKFVVTGAVPGLIASLYGIRLGLWTVAATGVFMALSQLAAPWPWMSSLLMAAAGLILGLCARRGWSAIAVQACIWCSLTLIAPPLALTGIDWASGRLGQVTVPVGMVLIGGLWAVVVSALLKSKLPNLTAKPLSHTVALHYGLALAILLGVAAFIASTWFTETTGGWLLLTILVIVRPGLSDTRSRVINRSVGTVAGGAIAALVGSVVVTHQVLLTGIAVVALVIALVLLVRKANYAVYAFALTIAVVLFNVDGPDVLSADIQRVGFTLAGAVLVAALAASYQLVVRSGLKKVLSS
ncbi:FUSC family protein [Nesterenkonia haasae]|uniref:FUSC family protein n=1 Tax=Nesterenkonia haasae TaxID=2587813 RepID=UPI001390BBD2|nr:FUSC family protein [Nesterenkonia haasae]